MADRGVVDRGRPFLPRFEQILAAPRFQRFVTKLPFVRGVAKREGAAIFDVLQGFVASQVLVALIDLGILRRLLGGPVSVEQLAHSLSLPEGRLEVLLRAAMALDLLKQKRDRRYALSPRGAALLGVPGLEAMIAHNRAFYADMADPVALLRDEADTELARVWPYVQGNATDPEAAELYSNLMEQSQQLVAEDTMRLVSFDDVTRLMDVGGGTGAFLASVLRRNRALEAILVDLPDVTPLAESALHREGIAARVSVCPQSFRDAALPTGADAISLVRVLYDHDDRTVADLVAKCFAALPPGGRLIVSEPMSGGAKPDPATDVYFAFYTMAMGTGRVRSPERIGELCRDAGFSGIQMPRALRPYITSVVTAERPA